MKHALLALALAFGCSAPSAKPMAPEPVVVPTGHAYLGTVFLIGQHAEQTPRAEGPVAEPFTPAPPAKPPPEPTPSPGVGASLRQMFVKGTLDRAAVSRIVKRDLARFRRCYERALKSDPDLEGELLLNFTIGADGAVQTASAPGSSLPREVTGCLLATFAKMKFPTSAGTTRVSYPLTFRTAAAPTAEVVPVVRACRAMTERPEWMNALRDSVQPCLEGALSRDSSLRARLRLHVPVDEHGVLGTPRAVGPGDRELEACVSNAASQLVRGASVTAAGPGAELIVSMAFVGDRQPSPKPFAYATESSLQYEGEVLGSGFDWLTGTREPFEALALLATRLESASADAVAMRVDERVDDYLLALLDQELGARADVLALEMQDDADAWVPLNPLGSPPPLDELCESSTRLVASVEPRIVTLTFGEHVRTVSTDDEGIEPATLRSVLAELSGPDQRLAGRSDAVVTYGGATFGAIAVVVRTLFDRGYFDVTLARRK